LVNENFDNIKIHGVYVKKKSTHIVCNKWKPGFVEGLSHPEHLQVQKQLFSDAQNTE